MAADRPFSDELEMWLQGPAPKTLRALTDVFAEKSFAMAFLLLMSISALPVPTGGITTVFEVITMLLAMELVLGRREPWLPRRWLDRELGPLAQRRTIPFLMRRIRWFERYSRRRGARVAATRPFLRVTGLLVLVFTLGSFVAPPFSGLDTLPAMGVVALALALVLEDLVVFAVGIVAGTTGLAIEVALGSTISRLLF